jgi:hypothetical protein
MTFRVEPAALAAYSAQVQRAREDAEECRRYFEREVPETTWFGNGGVFNPLYAEHGGVRDTVGDMLQHMATLLEAATAELNKASIYYRNTDAASASHMDGTLPVVPRQIPKRG